VGFNVDKDNTLRANIYHDGKRIWDSYKVVPSDDRRQYLLGRYNSYERFVAKDNKQYLLNEDEIRSAFGEIRVVKLGEEWYDYADKNNQLLGLDFIDEFEISPKFRLVEVGINRQEEKNKFAIFNIETMELSTIHFSSCQPFNIDRNIFVVDLLNNCGKTLYNAETGKRVNYRFSDFEVLNDKYTMVHLIGKNKKYALIDSEIGQICCEFDDKTVSLELIELPRIASDMKVVSRYKAKLENGEEYFVENDKLVESVLLKAFRRLRMDLVYDIHKGTGVRYNEEDKLVVRTLENRLQGDKDTVFIPIDADDFRIMLNTLRKEVVGTNDKKYEIINVRYFLELPTLAFKDKDRIRLMREVLRRYVVAHQGSKSFGKKYDLGSRKESFENYKQVLTEIDAKIAREERRLAKISNDSRILFGKEQVEALIDEFEDVSSSDNQHMICRMVEGGHVGGEVHITDNSVKKCAKLIVDMDLSAPKDKSESDFEKLKYTEDEIHEISELMKEE
ncbi:MAG: hypothetical protein IKC49_01975, partial [Clostridia bacterium]|nr:hypothetical protein [Clostridia bacterium]